MELRTWLGLFLSAVGIAGAIYTVVQTERVRAKLPEMETPRLDLWPIPAIPIRTMGVILAALCSLGALSLAFGLPQPGAPEAPEFVVMNCFVGFLAVAIACVVRPDGVANRVLSCAAGTWGVLNLINSLHPFGLGDWLFEHRDIPQLDHGAMAPFAAIGLILAAAAAGLLRGTETSLVRSYVVGVIGALLFLYGNCAILGYAAGSYTVLTWDGWRPVPLGSAFLLATVGMGFASKIYHATDKLWSQRELQITINALIGIVVMSVGMSLLYAFLSPAPTTDKFRSVLVLSLLVGGVGALGLLSIRRAMLEKTSCHNPNCPQFLPLEAKKKREEQFV